MQKLNDMEQIKEFGLKSGKKLGKLFDNKGKGPEYGSLDEEIALGNRMAEGFKKNAKGKVF